ncbi:MAG: GTP cyclohydrolase I FolE, partial [Bacteroidota bacterium]
MADEQMPRMEGIVRELLAALGEDPAREGLAQTPRRVARAYQFLTEGYRRDARSVVNEAVFAEEYNEMVIVKDIDFFSLCEHHLLPFFGKAHIAYIPQGRIIGLSKMPRIVDVFARRLQVQERMTQQIASTLYDALGPDGVGVVIEARHMCM